MMSDERLEHIRRGDWTAADVADLVTEVDRLKAFAVQELLEHDRHIARLAHRNAQRSGDLVNRVRNLREQVAHIRTILAKSAKEWPLWQTGLQSIDRHQFLMRVVGEISAAVFNDDGTPAEGLPPHARRAGALPGSSQQP
jgi:hypothetical protein